MDLIFLPILNIAINFENEIFHSDLLTQPSFLIQVSEQIVFFYISEIFRRINFLDEKTEGLS